MSQKPFRPRGDFKKPPSRPTGARPGLETRRLALDVLLDVVKSGAYASLALDKRLSASNLDTRDKALATEMAMGTLENRLRLDYILRTYMEREVNDAIGQEILRLGCYQILFLDRVPDMAACDLSAELAGALVPHLKGMVNGVLRNISRGKEANKPIIYPDMEKEPAQYISVITSTPLWMVETFISLFGVEEAAALLRPQRDKSTTLRINPLQTTPDEMEAYLTAHGYTFEKGQVEGSYRVLGGGNLAEEAAYEMGNYSIQGQSSLLCARVMDAQKGRMYLDTCAAPGGKAALMCEQMAGTGRVHAWDIHEHRVGLMRAMAKRLSLENLRPAVRDATLPKPDYEGLMDGVLIDAPCTGLGVLHDKPDLKYRIAKENIDSLVELQKKILDTCCLYVKKGGTLVYSTCTILPRENEEQVQEFLARHPEFEAQPLDKYLPETLKGHAQGAGLQLFPHKDGMEGFYIARMVRKA